MGYRDVVKLLSIMRPQLRCNRGPADPQIPAQPPPGVDRRRTCVSQGAFTVIDRFERPFRPLEHHLSPEMGLVGSQGTKERALMVELIGGPWPKPLARS
jgi:hypothetical protein